MQRQNVLVRCSNWTGFTASQMLRVRDEVRLTKERVLLEWKRTSSSNVKGSQQPSDRDREATQVAVPDSRGNEAPWEFPPGQERTCECNERNDTTFAAVHLRRHQLERGTTPNSRDRPPFQPLV
jgi:hypothetical protein